MLWQVLFNISIGLFNEVFSEIDIIHSWCNSVHTSISHYLYLTKLLIINFLMLTY